MAYINAQDVRAIRNALKERFKNTKFSVRLGANSHSSIYVTIKEAPDYFVEDKDNPGKPAAHAEINHYNLDRFGYRYVDVLKEMLRIINTAGSRENFDESDPMTDYFHVGYYVHLRQGEWDKPFVLNPKGRGK